MQIFVPIISWAVTAIFKKLRTRIPDEALPVVAMTTGIICQVMGDTFGITNGAELAGSLGMGPDGGVLAGIASGSAATGFHQVFKQLSRIKG